MQSVMRQACIIWRQIIIRAGQIPGFGQAPGEGYYSYQSNPSMYASSCLIALLLRVLNCIPT
jgi:hypothetical protein